MYLTHYGLTKDPFSISPDPEFIWFSSKHREAFATLKYGIEEDKGFLVLTGDIGTGKTLLIKNLEKTIPIPTIIVTVPDPDMKPLEFFRFFAEEVQLKKEFKSKGEFLIHFKNFLLDAYGSHKKVLLILDEAQRLNHRLLEEIRLLSNLEMTNRKLINIFFVGQNEFTGMLNDNKSKAVRQRITVAYHLNPLTHEETTSYIEHRLNIAGTTKQIFRSDAIEEIYNLSQGYPRVINILCDNALRYGANNALPLLGSEEIKAIANQLPIPETLKQKIIAQKKEERLFPEEKIIAFKAPASDNEEKDELYVSDLLEEDLSEQPAEERLPENAAIVNTPPLAAADAKNESVENPTAAYNEQELNEPELQALKALVVSKPRKVAEQNNPQAGRRYTFPVILLLVLGITGYFIYSTRFDSNSRYSIEDIAPKKKFEITENKQPVFGPKEADQKIVPKEKRNIQNASKGVEKSASKQTFEEIVQLNEQKPQQAMRISNTVSKDSVGSKDASDISAATVSPKESAQPAVSNASAATEDKVIIFFPFDSTDLPEHARTTLSQLFKRAAGQPELTIIVEGYTDNFGNFWYNHKLSKARADAIKNYFVNKGIDPLRIKAIGMGSEYPLDSNATAEGRSRNRRVEIKLRYKDFS